MKEKEGAEREKRREERIVFKTRQKKENNSRKLWQILQPLADIRRVSDRHGKQQRYERENERKREQQMVKCKMHEDNMQIYIYHSIESAVLQVEV